MHVGLPYGVFLFSPSVSVFFRSHEVSSSEWEMRGKRANCDAETATTLVAVQLKPSDFPSKTQRFPPSLCWQFKRCENVSAPAAFCPLSSLRVSPAPLQCTLGPFSWSLPPSRIYWHRRLVDRQRPQN